MELRGTDTSEEIEKRLQRAHYELSQAHRYRYQVVNDDLDRAVKKLVPFSLNRRRSIAMIDELREEAIVNKVGGRFKLSTLIQKRLVAINGGARPLVDATKYPNKMEVVIQEILQDKIFLDAQMNVQVTGAATGGLPDVDFRTL